MIKTKTVRETRLVGKDDLRKIQEAAHDKDLTTGQKRVLALVLRFKTTHPTALYNKAKAEGIEVGVNFITDVISDMRRMGIPLPKSGTGRLADSVVVEIPKGQYRRKITLSGTEYRVLMFIQGKEVRPGPTEISQKLSIKRNTVRNALISLKRKGFAIPYSKDGFPTGKRAPTTKEFVIDGKEYQLTAREQRFFNAAMEVGYHVEPIAKQSGLPRERVLEIADKLRRRGIAIPIWGRPRPPWFVVKERLNTTSIRKTAESFGKSTALITRMMKEHQYRTPRSQYKGRPRPAYIRKHR